MKYVVVYEPADDVITKAMPYLAAHQAHTRDFHSRGVLLESGLFGNPQENGSMAVLTTRDGAEEFAKSDPFVLNGVVRAWNIREWNEVFG